MFAHLIGALALRFKRWSSVQLCPEHQVSPGRPGASRIGTSEKLQVQTHQFKDSKIIQGGCWEGIFTPDWSWLVSVSTEHRWRVSEIFSATPHPQLCSLGAVDFLNQVWDALIFIYKGRTWKSPGSFFSRKQSWYSGNGCYDATKDEERCNGCYDAMMNTLFLSFFPIFLLYLLCCSLQACHPWKVISVMLCGHSHRCTHCWYRCHALRAVHHRFLPCWRCLCKQRAGHQNASEMSRTSITKLSILQVHFDFWMPYLIFNDYGPYGFTDPWLVHSVRSNLPLTCCIVIGTS